MSSNSEDTSAVGAEAAARELRRFTGLSASLLRAAAARIGMTITDIQVIDILDGSGAATPGELAELTGLTTGAIAGMLNRLEESGLLRRDRDPTDGRRVIVQIDRTSDRWAEIEGTLQSMTLSWNKTVSEFDEEQTAVIAEFLRRSNAMSRAEMVRLRQTPKQGEEISSAPLEGARRGHLVVAGATLLKIGVEREMTDLYQARFEGAAPVVKAREGVVSIRYPRKLSNLFGAQRSVAVTLGAKIPWQITVQGGAAVINAELAGLELLGFEAKGGASVVRLELPGAAAVVPVRLSGGASDIIIHRPSGVAVRAHLKGWASHFGLDGHTYDAVGNDVWLQSSDYDATGPSYTIEVASSASSISISSV